MEKNLVREESNQRLILKQDCVKIYKKKVNLRIIIIDNDLDNNDN